MNEIYRIITPTHAIGAHLSDYIWWHPAIMNFLDHDYPHNLRKRNGLFIVKLTNGDRFIFGAGGPWGYDHERGRRYDHYAEYTIDNVPIEVLLIVIQAIVGKDGGVNQ